MLRISSQDCFNQVDKEKETISTFKGTIEYWHYGNQKTDDRVGFHPMLPFVTLDKQTK